MGAVGQLFLSLDDGSGKGHARGEHTLPAIGLLQKFIKFEWAFHIIVMSLRLNFSYWAMFLAMVCTNVFMLIGLGT